MEENEKGQNMLFLDGSSLTIDVLQDLFRKNKSIDLTPEAWTRVRKSRQIITRMMSDPKRVVYGINTGFGNFADKIISMNERKQLQINLVCSHAVGVGQPLSPETCKRTMLLRINTLAKGRSGISAENLHRYIKAFNADYIPMIPEKGTVGASGDLAPLAHLAVGMLGQGLVWDSSKKEYVEAFKLMKKLNLQPFDLNEKEGLALINGTQFMTSILSQSLKNTERVLQSAIVVLAFSLQIFGLEHKNFNQKVLKLYQKSNPSLAYIMRKISSYFDEQPSALQKQRARNGQQNNRADSVLQACQALAGVHDTLKLCIKVTEEELNSATDNPLVYAKQDGFEEDMLISAGNFHGEYVAKCSDFLGMAIYTMGQYSEARIERYINERFSKLPSFLINRGGLNSGFMIAQYTSAALLSQSKVLVKPASADTIQTSASQQDHVSMGGFAARKSKLLLQNIAFILGIELMVALQSVDLLSEFKPSKKLQQIHQKVRKEIPYLETDQFFGPKITVAKDLIMKNLNEL